VTTIRLDVPDSANERLPEGSVGKARRYSELLAAKAATGGRWSAAKPLSLTPMVFARRRWPFPVDNPVFLLAKKARRIGRPRIGGRRFAFRPIPDKERVQCAGVGWLRSAISTWPSSRRIYPEWCSQGDDPPDPGDFRMANRTGDLLSLKGPYRMIVGLRKRRTRLHHSQNVQWTKSRRSTHGMTKRPTANQQPRSGTAADTLRSVLEIGNRQTR